VVVWVYVQYVYYSALFIEVGDKSCDVLEFDKSRLWNRWIGRVRLIVENSI
jgi:hypothetical protein